MISDVTPSEVSLMGGSTLTIRGTGFTDDYREATVLLGRRFDCPVISATPTEIKCVVPPLIGPEGPVDGASSFVRGATNGHWLQPRHSVDSS